jgi:hypothetical protein
MRALTGVEDMRPRALWRRAKTEDDPRVVRPDRITAGARPQGEIAPHRGALRRPRRPPHIPPM